ncbi:MAG: hypothetical protein ACK56F_01540 [bacterium]
MERQAEKEQLTRKNKECKGPDSLPVTKIKEENPNQPTKHLQTRRPGSSHRYPAAAPREGHCHLNKDVCIKQPGGHPVDGERKCPCQLSPHQSRSYIEA